MVTPEPFEKAARLFGREALRLEQPSHAAVRGRLVRRLAHPRRGVERDGLEILVLLKRTLQRVAARRLPLPERGADARIGIGDERRERVRVVAAERLLAALVRAG